MIFIDFNWGLSLIIKHLKMDAFKAVYELEREESNSMTDFHPWTVRNNE